MLSIFNTGARIKRKKWGKEGEDAHRGHYSAAPLPLGQPPTPLVDAALKAMLVIYYGPFVCHSSLNMIFFSCSSFDTKATMALIPSTVNEQVWGAGS